MDRANDSQWLPALGLAFLTYNSAAAVYRSVDDPWAVGFVVVAYVDLLLLFWCLRKFERSTESNRGGLKAAVWFLATLLTGMFAHKVAAIMPWPVAAIVYCMAAATAGGDGDSQQLSPTPLDPPSSTANTEHDADARLSTLGLAVLTYSSVTAVYRSRDDPSAVAFVVIAYADLLLLLRCVRCLEGGTAADRPRLKAAVWCLATLLTLMFSYKVAAIMPRPVAVMVWSMAAAVCLGGFWALFLCREPSSQSNAK